MEYKEFTCVICGKKALDKSTTQSRMYCSQKCASIAYERNRKMRRKCRESCCVYNPNVLCWGHKCSNCGWNPKVETRRKEALGYG